MSFFYKHLTILGFYQLSPGRIQKAITRQKVDVVSSSRLHACRAVVGPHIELKICTKHKYHTNVLVL